MSSSSKLQNLNVSAGKVYTVGNGEGYGQVGMGNARDITHPVPIIGLEYEKITEIVSSSLHTLALNEKGEIWSWGCNDYGALGRSDEESIPRPISHPSVWHIKFAKIACGNSISMAVSTKGLLYTWGTFISNNNIFGYLPNTQIQTYPRIVNDLAKLNITDIAVGASHCLALSDNGKVYSWGCPEFNSIGIQTRNGLQGLVPASIPELDDIVSITCGSYHSFAVNKYGQLFAWGWNNFQQCGLVEKVSEKEELLPKNIICRPTMVPYFKIGHKIQRQMHINLEQMNDTIDQLGSSEYDEPVTNVIKHGIVSPNTISYSTRPKIKSVSAGDFHTIVLMDNNSLIVFGRCDQGQLGLVLYSNFHYFGAMKSGDTSSINAIGYPLEHLWHCEQEIIKVVCGNNHSLILARDGSVYGFGHSGDCQLGLYIHETIPLPTLIQSFQGKIVINASAGDRFSMFVVA